MATHRPSALPALLLALWLPAVSACRPAAPTAALVRSREASIPPEAVRCRPEDDPHPPRLLTEGWLPPVPLPPPVNTAGVEDSPFLAPDGRTLLFFFTPSHHIPAEGQLVDGVSGIYISRRTADVWGEPQRLMLQYPDALALDGCPFLLGDTLWFCSARAGNLRGVDLWTATLRDEAAFGWSHAGPRLNAELQVGEMHLSADGGAMIYHAPGPDGDLDLFSIQRRAEGWSAPQPFAELNSPADEGWPFLSDDGQELWFSRSDDGGFSVYRALRQGPGWGPPERILTPLAGEPTLDRQGNLIFVHACVIDGVVVETDLYFAARP